MTDYSFLLVAQIHNVIFKTNFEYFVIFELFDINLNLYHFKHQYFLKILTIH